MSNKPAPSCLASMVPKIQLLDVNVTRKHVFEKYAYVGVSYVLVAGLARKYVLTHSVHLKKYKWIVITIALKEVTVGLFHITLLPIINRWWWLIWSAHEYFISVASARDSRMRLWGKFDLHLRLQPHPSSKNMLCSCEVSGSEVTSVNEVSNNSRNSCSDSSPSLTILSNITFCSKYTQNNNPNTLSVSTRIQ